MSQLNGQHVQGARGLYWCEHELMFNFVFCEVYGPRRWFGLSRGKFCKSFLRDLRDTPDDASPDQVSDWYHACVRQYEETL